MLIKAIMGNRLLATVLETCTQNLLECNLHLKYEHLLHPKDLGVRLDRNLSFENHISNGTRKTAKCISQSATGPDSLVNACYVVEISNFK